MLYIVDIQVWLLLFSSFAYAASAYVPTDVRCPEHPIVRSAGDGLSAGESEWIQQRDPVQFEALLEWLGNSNMRDFDPYAYLSNMSQPDINTIRIGLSFSGGGFRAMLSGAGMLAALDNQTYGSNHHGGIGGLLQASSYIAGLSGGSWLLASVVMNNWEPIPELQADKDLWNFQSPFNPTAKHWPLQGFQPGWDLNVAEEVSAKGNAGYPTSITDVWGRLLSAQTLPGPDAGSSLHWSDVTKSSFMVHHTMPMPILVADSVAGKAANTYDTSGNTVHPNGDLSVTLNSTLYEITPFEFGSWDPSVYSFVDTQYLGSELVNGRPSTTDCTLGYDNVGFLMGASSTLFNKLVQGILSSSGTLQRLYNDIIGALGGTQFMEIAIIGANPFNGIKGAVDYVKDSETLSLVDGGEDGQNVPLDPLIERERGLDLVLAFDNSADTQYNWPSGASMYATYQRQFLPQGNSTAFPTVPDPSKFLAEGLTRQPTFFGCSVDQYDGRDEIPPIVVYIANADRGFLSNTSTWKLDYSNHDRDSIIRNGYNVATQRNGTMDPEWRSCLGCATILREQQRRGDAPTRQCSGCFQRYCYDPPQLD